MSNLFHSLVVCGAGLTLLQCGGRSVQPGSTEENTEGGANTGSGAVGGADSSVAGSGTLGGASSNSSGSAGVGGSTEILDGPSGVGVDPNLPAPQWQCDGHAVSCTQVNLGGVSRSVVLLDQRCPTNLARPRGEFDCKTGETFSCLLATLDGQRAGPVNCECSARATDPCRCPAAIVNCSSATVEACSVGSAYCGCALTCILK